MDSKFISHFFITKKFYVYGEQKFVYIILRAAEAKSIEIARFFLYCVARIALT